MTFVRSWKSFSQRVVDDDAVSAQDFDSANEAILANARQLVDDQHPDMRGDLNANNRQVMNLSDPSDADHVVTVGYLKNNVSAGLWKLHRSLWHGEIVFVDEAVPNLPAWHYACDGAIYPKDTEVGAMLAALPKEIRENFGIWEDDTKIATPRFFDEKGRYYFMRYGTPSPAAQQPQIMKHKHLSDVDAARNGETPQEPRGSFFGHNTLGYWYDYPRSTERATGRVGASYSSMLGDEVMAFDALLRTPCIILIPTTAPSGWTP